MSLSFQRLFSLRRLRTLITKEVIQMRRDRITFAMMIGVPLMQLMLFGFAINSDPKGLPAALVAPTQDRFTRAMVSALETTGYYRFTHVGLTAAEAEFLISRGDVSFVVTVPSDFGHRVLRGDHPQILIEADATDPSVASGAISTLGTVAADALLRETGGEAEARARGTALHLLLERLPGLAEADWDNLATTLIPDPRHLTDALAEARLVLNHPDLAPLFGPETLAEVAVTAPWGDRTLTGTIDRLVITPDRILIIDYKSNAVIPDRPEAVPEGILRQLGAYAHMLSQIYPDRRIETAILWTKGPSLMPVDPDIVRQAFLRTTIP